MKLNDNQLQALLADSRYHDIGALPSQFHGYNWKQMYIRPFGIEEYKLISKAATLKEMSHMIRAIDLVVTQDAENLTIGDFYYVMMWLRIHSLPKTPLVIDWACPEDALYHKETGAIVFNEVPYVQPENMSDYELRPCNTQNTESIHMTNVEIISLEEEGVILPEGFDFPRAKHIEGISAALANPETSMLVAGAQWIAGETMADKFATLFASADGLDMFDTGNSLNELLTHGVKEIVQLNCRKCRHTEPYALNITPQTFFR